MERTTPTRYLFCSLIFALGACSEDTGGGETPSPEPEMQMENTPPDLEVCKAENGPFSLTIDNPYLPLVVGEIHEIGGIEADEGEPVRFTTEVLDETREIGGVVTRVVEQRDFEGDDLDELVEVARSFFAQAPDGTVCMFGEEADILEEGEVVEQESWTAGEEGALAGIAMPGSPEVGLLFTRIFVPEDEEIDVSEITELGVPFETPAGTFDDVMTVLEVGPSIKKYARGVGQIFDDDLVLTDF